MKISRKITPKNQIQVTSGFVDAETAMRVQVKLKNMLHIICLQGYLLADYFITTPEIEFGNYRESGQMFFVFFS